MERGENEGEIERRNTYRKRGKQREKENQLLREGELSHTPLAPITHSETSYLDSVTPNVSDKAGKGPLEEQSLYN